LSEGYWENEENVKRYIHWLGEKMEIKDLQDWDNVGVSELMALKGASLKMKYKGLENLLAAVYPNYKPKLKSVVYKGFSKTQRHLFKMVNALFPGYEIQVKFHVKLTD
jgi:hypothetical protein